MKWVVAMCDLKSFFIILFLIFLATKSEACDLIPELQGGSTRTDEGYNEGDTVFFQCDEGYSLIGSPSTTCMGDEWTRPMPQCIQDCTNTGTPFRGDQEGYPSYKAYTTVSFTCSQGHALVGASKIMCKGGAWSRPVPLCEANCGDPGIPRDGTPPRIMGTPTYLQGTTISYLCAEGYTLVGAQVLSCKGGKWSRDVPRCVANSNRN